MLNTVLGEINITVNEMIYEYSQLELSNTGQHFAVDKRYQLTVENIDTSNEDVTVCCKILNCQDKTLIGSSDSGEGLALISFFSENIELSIGTEGDIHGVIYNYLDDGISMIIKKGTPIELVVFMVAWLETSYMLHNNNNTWFAGDPSEI
jgi:hypothetical protein